MKERNSELLKNTVIIALGQICTKFLWLLFLPVYTRFLTPQELGLFDLYSTYCTLLEYVIFLQMEQGIFRFLLDARGDISNQKEAVSSVTAVCIPGFVLLAGTALILCFLKNNIWNDQIFIPVMTLSIGCSSLTLQTCRGLGDNVTYALGGIVSASVQLTLNLIFIFLLKCGTTGLFCACVCGNMICALFIFLHKRLWLLINPGYFRYHTVKKILRYSIFLIPNAVSWWIIYASDRTITAFAFGTAANGLLAVASRFASALSSAYNIFHLSWVESASVHIHDQDRQVYFDTVINTAFQGFMSVFFVLLSGFAACFPLFIGQNYAGSYALFPMYLGAAMLNVVQGLYSVFYVAEKRTAELAGSTIASAIMNIVSYLLLLRPCGILGAGYSTLISYAAVTLWRYYDIRGRLHVRLNRKLVITGCLVSSVLLIVYYMGNPVENAIACAVAAIVCLRMNWKTVNVIFYKVVKYMKRGK